MFGRIGSSELLLVFGIVLVIFGPRKLPEIGRSLGKGLQEFRQATREMKQTIDMAAEDEAPETKEA